MGKALGAANHREAAFVPMFKRLRLSRLSWATRQTHGLHGSPWSPESSPLLRPAAAADGRYW